MTDLERILPLWHELESTGADYVLATVVAVEGSSYRKPGARMLLAADGRRAGTVSGGCLEAEVTRRAWWLTSDGPKVERYSTIDDDGDLPYGSGCAGIVHILLERRTTAAPLLCALESAFARRVPLAIATVLSGSHLGQRSFAGLTPGADHPTGCAPQLHLSINDLAERAYLNRSAINEEIHIDDIAIRVWVDYRPARPGLWIFGAGDDAKPLLALARELGWFVAVSDGRSHLTTRERFSAADRVEVLDINKLPTAASFLNEIRPGDTAALMTHSFDQDSRILSALLAKSASNELPVTYLGVLGPQRRTRELIVTAARLNHRLLSPDQVDALLAQLHAPMGLDLGAETPATIALSILSEIQQTLQCASARPLRKVRATVLNPDIPHSMDALIR